MDTRPAASATAQLTDGRTVAAAFEVADQLSDGSIAHAAFQVFDGEAHAISLRVVPSPDSGTIDPTDTQGIDLTAMRDFGLARAERGGLFSDIDNVLAAGAHSRRKREKTQSKMNRDEKLRRVAEVYTNAVGSKAPTHAVMDDLGLSRAAASEWVRRARNAGYITVDAPRR